MVDECIIIKTSEDLFMGSWFIDTECMEINDGSGRISVDRLYCFKILEFTQEHWDKLGEIYRSLPSYLGSKRGPHWFGEDDDNDYLNDEDSYEGLYYLTASVENLGLQVYGVLKLEEWLAWTKVFDEKAVELPHYEMRNWTEGFY
jgi:hypothetical protein